MLPWMMTPEQQELLRYYLKLRYRLHPYLYSSAIEAHRTGRPILGALVFDYQDDMSTYDKDFHFMLGRQILTAPVLKKTDKWDVYLPKGNWIHYWTGRRYGGGRTVTVDAPLYSKAGLPMFVKGGAIIPMMPEMSYIYEREPDPITLDIYPEPAKSSTYVVYDCDTVKNPIEKTVLECSEDKTTIEVSISPSSVAYELWVHLEKQPASVVVDSSPSPKLGDKSAYRKAQEGWYYGPGCFLGSDNVRTVNIRVPKGSRSHLVQITK
jgi:alpha-glucosidase (family GH31 glycosyl hydrolase)